EGCMRLSASEMKPMRQSLMYGAPLVALCLPSRKSLDCHGDIPVRSAPAGLCGYRWGISQRLIHDTIALGELDQARFLVIVEIALDVKAKADIAKSNLRVLGNPQGATEIEVAFRPYIGLADVEPQGGRNRIECNSSA